MAEQAVYNRRNDAVQRLSSSNETTALQLDEIKQLFGNGEQDIEWAFAGGKLVILQARPYLNGRR